MATSSSLLAAAGKVELVPPAGGRLGGFGCRFEAHRGSLDALHARVVLLQQGDTQVVWISCDLLGFSTTFDQMFRDRVASRLLIEPQNVLISCTHTHSAPVAMPARGPSGIADANWLRTGVFEHVASFAASLREQLRPIAQIKTGTQLVSGLGYNRQDAAAPIDERVITAALMGEGGNAIATFVNYALHPVVIGEHNLKCSADYPGYVCASVEKTLGGVAMFIQGSCGDVDPVLYRDAGRDAGTVTHLRDMGEQIASAAIASLQVSDDPSMELALHSCRITVPLDSPPTMDELVALRASFGEDRTNYQLIWADELMQGLEKHRVPDHLSAQVTALRIGSIYVITFPFEIYSQIGLDLRQQLSPRHVIIAAYTHGLIGYVVTTAAKKLGGYGAGFSHRYFPELLTAIGTGSDELLVKHGVSMLRSLG
jgi:hypothetical protein